MRNQFFYTQKDPIPGKEGEFTEFRASFNVEKIIRSLALDDGRVLVLLDDLHQRPQMIEVKNKQGKVTAVKKEMNTFQSEIYLVDKSDIERFYTWTSIDS
jgi:hypothetical protein